MYDEQWLREYYARQGKPMPDDIAAQIGQQPKKSKYNSTPTVMDGKRYDSKREANRAGELKLMAQAREIVGFAEQVTIHIPGDHKYIADFVVLNRDGTYTVEDTKGVKTPVYKLKRDLVREEYGIELREV